MGWNSCVVLRLGWAGIAGRRASTAPSRASAPPVILQCEPLQLEVSAQTAGTAVCLAQKQHHKRGWHRAAKLCPSSETVSPPQLSCVRSISRASPATCPGSSCGFHPLGMGQGEPGVPPGESRGYLWVRAGGTAR